MKLYAVHKIDVSMEFTDHKIWYSYCTSALPMSSSSLLENAVSTTSSTTGHDDITIKNLCALYMTALSVFT